MIEWIVKSQFGVYFLTQNNDKAHIKFEEDGDLSSVAKRIMNNGLTVAVKTANVPSEYSLYDSIYVPANRILLVVKY